jgi:hypothetical protein
MGKSKDFPFYYSIFNLTVGSDIALPECLTIERPKIETDFFIEVVDAVLPLKNQALSKSYFQISASAYYLDLSPLARFSVTQGKSIQIQLLSTSRSELIRRYLLSRVFTVLLYQRSIFPLAGCALFSNGKGLLLCGESVYARSILPKSFESELLSAYLTAIGQEGQVTAGYGHVGDKVIPSQKRALNQFDIIYLKKSSEVKAFELEELKGASSKLNVLKNCLAYGEVLSQIKTGALAKASIDLLKIPMFQLILPTENFSYHQLKTRIKKKLE